MNAIDDFVPAENAEGRTCYVNLSRVNAIDYVGDITVLYTTAEKFFVTNKNVSARISLGLIIRASQWERPLELGYVEQVRERRSRNVKES